MSHFVHLAAGPSWRLILSSDQVLTRDETALDERPRIVNARETSDLKLDARVQGIPSRGGRTCSCPAYRECHTTLAPSIRGVSPFVSPCMLHSSMYHGKYCMHIAAVGAQDGYYSTTTS